MLLLSSDLPLISNTLSDLPSDPFTDNTAAGRLRIFL